MPDTAGIIRSVNVGVNSMFGVACKNSAEFYVSSSADAGGLFLVNVHWETGHCERVLSSGSESLKQVHGIYSKSDGKVVLVDRGANKVKEFDVVYPNKWLISLDLVTLNQEMDVT